jgi:RNA polymerase sigma-54 factor
MNGGGMRFSQAQRQQFSLQMQHALRLLQLSNLELAAEISAEVSANPLLDPVQPPAPSIDAPAGAGSAAITQPFDYSGASASRAAPAGAGLEPPSRPETLVEHLLAQLACSPLDEKSAFLAQALIGEIDADGYLRADLAGVAERLGASLADIERVLKVLQGFEPTGVFARDVAECLALQLAERDRLDPLMQALLDRLDLVAQGDRAKLRAALGCEREDLDDMLAELKALTPRPGLAFGFEPPAVIIPEVRVVRSPDGSWTVESWAPHLPRLVVREGRFERLAAKCRRQEDMRYLKERLSAARRFSDLIARRGRTVLEVAGEIVKRQEGFLLHGVAGLKPLMLKTVAEALDMHESTVSRAVNNKAMLTPRGVVPFKAFFAAAATTLDGSDATQSQVIARIGALIAGESKTGTILSDEAIAEKLADEGVKIARRTVAKHREGLGLPIATRRRAVLASAHG